MKYIVYILFAVLCILAQEGKKVQEEDSGKFMLVGTFEREALQDTSFAWWFNSGHDNYDVDSTTLDDLKDKLGDVRISIVMGTWCSDSRREVPRFYKVLDYLEYDPAEVTLISVDRDLKGLDDEVEGKNIKAVPTFIFYHGDEEIGRIIESPEESLEKDMSKLLSGEK